MLTSCTNYYWAVSSHSELTMHGSLIWLRNFREPEGQLARWLEKLGEYNFTIIHRRHCNADALSRLPCKQCGQASHTVTDERDGKTTVSIRLELYRFRLTRMMIFVSYSLLIQYCSLYTPPYRRVSLLLLTWLAFNAAVQFFVYAEGSAL